MRVISIILCVAFGSLGLHGETVAADEKAEFTIPTCLPKKYPIPITDNKGALIEGPKGNLYCEGGDFSQWTFQNSPLRSLLDHYIGDAQVKSIVMSDFYYSEETFPLWLCHLNLAPDAALKVYYQQSQTVAAHLSDAFANNLKECGRSIQFLPVGCDVFVDGNACRGGNVNTLHAKIVFLQLSDGSAVVLQGSGNLNKALYANIEDWLVSKFGASDDEAYRYRCIFMGLGGIAGLDFPPTGFLTSLYERCLSRWNIPSESAGDVSTYFLPNDSQAWRTRLLAAISQAVDIRMSTQFLSDPSILGALSASKADLHFILDDDWYWVLEKGSPAGVVDVDDAGGLKQLIQSKKPDIRYVMTNHHNGSGPGNTNHLRFFIIKASDGSSVVFTGSAQLKKGSINGNIELQSVIRKPEIVSDYADFFEALSLRSVGSEDMPTVDVIAH